MEGIVERQAQTARRLAQGAQEDRFLHWFCILGVQEHVEATCEIKSQ